MIHENRQNKFEYIQNYKNLITRHHKRQGEMTNNFCTRTEHQHLLQVQAAKEEVLPGYEEYLVLLQERNK